MDDRLKEDNMKTLNQVPISTAISNITSTLAWEVVNDYDLSTVVWHDQETSRPTDAEIQAERQRIADEYNSTEYINLRKNGKIELVFDDNGEHVPTVVEPGYPSIEEQLDTLYHGGLDVWKAQIQEVKNRFPKP
jgi:hypothetical protein